MEQIVRRHRIIALALAILVVAAAAALWVGAVERWIGQQLRALAADHLVPAFDFDDLTYTFPRTITLRGVRLTSPDPEATGQAIEILAMDSLTLVLSGIPRPDQTFRMQQLALARPTLRLVRIPAGEDSGSLLGFSQLLKEGAEPAAAPGHRPARPSELFEVSVAIEDGRAQFDPREGDAAIMLIDGIVAKLLLQPESPGAYAVDFSLDEHPLLTLALRGKLLADERRLDVASLSSTLALERDQYHYLTPAMQKLVAARGVTGRLTIEASGSVAFDDTAAFQLRAHVSLDEAGIVAGDHGLALDRLDCRLSAADRKLAIEAFTVDTLGGHARAHGGFSLDDSLQGELHFEGEDLQIGGLLRGAKDPRGVPAYSGLLGFSGTLRGPLAEIDRRAQGQGRLSLREARLANLPVLSTIDQAIDPLAEAIMKREHKGRDVLSLRFSFEGDRTHIADLRVNSRWYGLRGHGDVYSNSRLDLAVDGGPIQRLENELGWAGDVLGEITETLLRARVTGRLAEPKVGIEVLRGGVHR
jgi:hypothetical protein